MRSVGALVVIALLAGGCTSVSPAGSPTTSSTAPPAQPTTTVTQPAAPTTQPSSAPSTTPRPGSHVNGTLPDGTPYSVSFETAVDRVVQSISGAIMIDLDDGHSRAFGRTFLLQSSSTAHENDLTLTFPAGEGMVHIDVHPEVAELLGDSFDTVLSNAITPGTMSRLPTLVLAAPLRWATDEEIPLQMEVVYESFVVRRGCGELAAACSATGAAQVIPADRVLSGTPGLPPGQVWIESPAPRPTDQPTYLAQGPLSIRGGHDVLWTGSEMIVWGGAGGSERLPHLVDGAAFDPDSSTWRMLSPVPLTDSRRTRAVWAGDEMIVVSREATLAYNPVFDEWATIGDGLYPPEHPGLLVWAGEGVAAWTSSGIHNFDRASGAWTQLPHPGFGSSNPWDASLHALDGRLYAVGLAPGHCTGRLVSGWTGSEWKPAPPADLDTKEYADCSTPNQAARAGGQLIIWEDNIHRTLAYDPATNEWTEIATIPLGGAEGGSGPVSLDDGFLVPRWGEAAIFDAGAQEWTKVILPGNGSDHDLVWTGNELLMWGATCCYGDGLSDFTSIDAWRWSPPDS